MTAQGNAWVVTPNGSQALKGRNNVAISRITESSRSILLRPFRACVSGPLVPGRCPGLSCVGAFSAKIISVNSRNPFLIRVHPCSSVIKILPNHRRSNRKAADDLGNDLQIGHELFHFRAARFIVGRAQDGGGMNRGQDMLSEV